MKTMKKTKRVGSIAYAHAGVNLAAGDAFSGLAGQLGSDSFHNSPYVEVVDCSRGHFRGPRGWRYVYDKLPKDCFEVWAPDGIGTATIILSAANQYYTASSRLLAMTAGDITRFGGCPLVFTNILETKTLGRPDSLLFAAYVAMMAGLSKYAKDQGYVLMGGETAEMSDCVSSEIKHQDATTPIFNWSGVMAGINHPDKLITGATLARGQRVIALADALRSNGGSMARRLLRDMFSKGSQHWWANPDARPMIDEMATPAALYDRFLAEMNGWYSPDFKPIVKMHAIAHLSGGGIRSKFADDILFPRGFSAVLDNLHEPPQFMKECVRRFKMPDEEGYTIFNGGQGVLVVVDESDVGGFCGLAVDAGLDPIDAGYIYKSHREPRVRIHSRFSGKMFVMR